MKRLLDSKFKHPHKIHTANDVTGRSGILYMGTSASGKPPHVDVLRGNETGDVRASGMWREVRRRARQRRDAEEP